MTKQDYTLDNDWIMARERLRELEKWSDPATIRYLERIGVADGWHCIEIGAGGGSIAEWLCQRVGTTGKVIATDINTRFLDPLDYTNLEVWHHNIVEEEIPENQFDFAHARTFLMHIPERELVVNKMKKALKPGGWILLEEPSFGPYAADYSAKQQLRDLFDKVIRAQFEFWADSGVDAHIGAKLYSLLVAEGFESIGAEGEVNIETGASDFANFVKLTSSQWRDGIMSKGTLTDDDFDNYLALYDDPSFAWLSPITMAAWGQKPLS